MSYLCVPAFFPVQDWLLPLLGRFGQHPPREGMNWTEILKAGGIPEPPGYLETLERLRQNPYQERQAAKQQESKAKKRKSRPGLNSRHGNKTH